MTQYTRHRTDTSNKPRGFGADQILALPTWKRRALVVQKRPWIKAERGQWRMMMDDERYNGKIPRGRINWSTLPMWKCKGNIVQKRTNNYPWIRVKRGQWRQMMDDRNRTFKMPQGWIKWLAFPTWKHRSNIVWKRPKRPMRHDGNQMETIMTK